MERMICCCVSLSSGSGVEVVATNSEAFRMSLVSSPVVGANAECIWMREECGIMTGQEFEAFQLKIAVE